MRKLVFILTFMLSVALCTSLPAGQAEKAKTHMRQAAAAKLLDNYMHDVAKVHVKQRQWDR